MLNEKYAVASGKKQRSIFVNTDTTDSSQVEKVVKECVKQYGRLDMYGLPTDLHFELLLPQWTSQ